jgi:hypothetical protein
MVVMVVAGWAMLSDRCLSRCEHVGTPPGQLATPYTISGVLMSRGYKAHRW